MTVNFPTVVSGSSTVHGPTNEHVIDPELDGLNHLNVWSQAKTPLGRWLSNFTYSPFTHPMYGRFASVEAYWYWVASGRTQNQLRPLYGVSAKKVGIQIERVPMEEGDFHDAVTEAFVVKLATYPDMMNMLADNTLPLKHYFNYAGRIIDQTSRHGWQLERWETLSRMLRARREGREMERPHWYDHPVIRETFEGPIVSNLIRI